MELDNLKNTWNEPIAQVHKPLNLNPEMLEKMNNKSYRSIMKKITLPEFMGSLVCLAAATFIAFNINNLDTSLLQGAGLLAIFLLVLLPIISILSTRQLSNTGNFNKPYAEALKAFASQKIRFIKLQNLNVSLSYLLLVTMIVLISKLLNGQDLSENKHFWIFAFTIGYIFLLFYSKWVEKHYRKTLEQAEELLAETRA